MSSKAVHELKDQLSAVIAHVESTGEEVQVTKHGRVVARLVPPEPEGVVFGVGARPGVRVPDFEDLQWSETELSEMFDGPILPS